MKKIYIFFIILISTWFLINAWLPPEKEKINPSDTQQDIINKMLYPLNKLFKPVDNLKASAYELNSTISNFKQQADNISFEPVRNIQESDIQSGIIMIMQSLLEAPKLEEKKQYLSAITNYKISMPSNQYSAIYNISEQLYFYKQNLYNLNHEISLNKTKIQVMDKYIKDSIISSEQKLSQIKAIPGIAVKIPPDIDSRFATVKSDIAMKTNLMDELEAQLNKDTQLLADTQINLIARLNNQEIQEDIGNTIQQVTEATQTVEEVVTEASTNQLRDIASKLTELKAPAQLKLNQEIKKAIQYMYNDEPEKATEILQKQIKKNPNNWQARKYMAQIYIMNKDYDKALEEINKALDDFKNKAAVEK